MPLEPFGWSPRVILTVVAAVGACVVIITVVILWMGLTQREVTAVSFLILFGPVVAVIVAARFLATGPALKLTIQGGTLTVARRRSGRVLVRAPLSELNVSHGYYTVATQLASGCQPSIAIALPGARPLRIGTSDTRIVYYWKGDDPWKRRWNEGKRMGMPTHLVGGFHWVDLARALGLGDRLIVHPLPGA